MTLVRHSEPTAADSGKGRILSLSSVALLLFTLNPSAAVADETVGPTVAVADKTAAAKAYFAHGVAFFSEEHYAKALDAFTSSYKIHPKATTLFNMAMCNKALLRNREAILQFETFLRSKEGDDGMRRDASTAVDELLRLVGIVELIGVAPSSKIWINEALVGTTPQEPALILDPGIYRLRITRDGHIPFESSLTVAAGARSRVWAKLSPRSEAGPPTPAVQTPSPVLPSRAVPLKVSINPTQDAPGDGAPLFNAGVTAGIFGLAAIGAGVAFSVRYVVNRDTGTDALEHYKETSDDKYRPIYDDAEASMKTDRIGMALGYSIGSATLLAAGALFLLSHRRSTRGNNSRHHAELGPGTVRLTF